MAMVDQNVLRRILKHMLGNAVDMTTAGAVSLRIGYTKNKRLTFEVSDTGPGLEMAPNAADGDLPTIFQRYHQVLLPDDTADLEEATNIREKIERSMASHRKQGL